MHIILHATCIVYHQLIHYDDDNQPIPRHQRASLRATPLDVFNANTLDVTMWLHNVFPAFLAFLGSLSSWLILPDVP